jgi:SAM-dependent methyltransferase
MSKCICGWIQPIKVVQSGITSVYSRKNHDSYSLLECDNCKVLKTHPFPTSTELEDIYSRDYAYAFHDAVSMEKSFRAKAICRLILRNTSDLEILEFGSGSGIFMNQALKLGFKVTGIELSTKAGNALPLELQSKLITSSAEDFLSNSSSVPSIVVLSHTFEHFLEPDKILREIYLKMPNQGIAVLIVPNRKNIINRNRNRFWGYWQVPVHTYHFDRNSLTHIAKTVGFNQLKVSYRSGDFLSKGIFVSNFLKLPLDKVPGKSTHTFISFASRFWFAFYRFGRSDLILVARKIDL